jgi:hypothetical protein
MVVRREWIERQPMTNDLLTENQQVIPKNRPQLGHSWDAKDSQVGLPTESLKSQLNPNWNP